MLLNVLGLHAIHRCAEKNVFAAREILVETRAQFEQRRHLTIDMQLTGTGREGATQQLQKG